FLQAGLISRLQRNDRDYLVLPIMKPGADPDRAFARCIVGAYRIDYVGNNLKEAGYSWESTSPESEETAIWLVEHPVDVADMLRIVRNAARPVAARDEDVSLPTVILPIDQLEELRTRSGERSAANFYRMIAHALRGSLLIVIATCRSDAIQWFQTETSFW